MRVLFLFIVLVIYNGRSYKKVYESNFGTAYETYKEAVKKIVVLDFKA